MKKPNKRRPDRTRYRLEIIPGDGVWYAIRPHWRSSGRFGKPDPRHPHERVRWYFDTLGENGRNRLWAPKAAS